MEETKLIQQLKQREQSALETIISIYAAYVHTVVRNAIGTYMKVEDVEEVKVEWVTDAKKEVGYEKKITHYFDHLPTIERFHCCCRYGYIRCTS